MCGRFVQSQAAEKYADDPVHYATTSSILTHYYFRNSDPAQALLSRLYDNLLARLFGEPIERR